MDGPPQPKKKSSKSGGSRSNPLKRKEPPSSATQPTRSAPSTQAQSQAQAQSQVQDFVPTKAKDLSELLSGEEPPASFHIPPICNVPKCKKPRPAPPGARVQPTEDILGFDSQHSYIKRWVRMSAEEKKGSVKFSVVQNNGKRENLLLLLGIKNVFVKQLPNMPRPYVSRLVFDKKHESLALLKKNPNGEYVVMGGCCYRPFREQKFAEIAFLAISQSEQVRGYGTRLMAQTKERTKKIGLDYLLTCADNNAVPYFKKQGFSKKITLPFDKWQGYIKDYDGVTLMECVLHKNVDCLNIPMMLKAQKMGLVEKLKEISNSHIVFPGIDVEGKKGLSIEEIPGLKELLISKKDKSGNQRSASNIGFTDRDKTSQEILHVHLKKVLDELMNHQFAWPFLEPVNPKETGAIDYYDVIKNPIDLGTIKKKLEAGWFYVTKELFRSDLKRMVENCKTYNGKNHFITEYAIALEKVFNNKL